MAFAHIRLRSFFGWMILGAAVVYIPLMMLLPETAAGDSIFNVVSDTTLFLIFPLAWLFYKMNRNNVKFTSFLEKQERLRWGSIVFITMMGMILALGISTIEFTILSYLIPDVIDDFMSTEGIIDNNTTFTMIYSVISAVLYAPIMEEIIFRGFFLHRMAYKWGLKRAIFVSSLLFGLGHPDVIGATIFGIIMCLLYIKTKSLLMPMLVHALNNFIVSIIQVSSFGAWEEADQAQMSEISLREELTFGITLAAIGLIWFVWFLRNNWRLVRENGLPILRPIRQEEAVEQVSERSVYSQVVIGERQMTVELPDEVVNELQLEEDDYVKLEMHEGKVIVTKAHRHDLYL